MTKNKNRFKNKAFKVNNGLTDALNLPVDPMGNIYDRDLINKLMNGSAISQLITYNWVGLTNAYNKNSFLQTAVNQKVEDAFQNDGLIIESKTLDTDELEELHQVMQKEGDIQAIIDCIRWGRLYGGGCLVANTEQDYGLPLDLKQLKGKKLQFLATNRWQCFPLDSLSPFNAKSFTFTDNLKGLESYSKKSNSSNLIIDASRVGLFIGENAPYLTRAMLQGWNASIFEGILEPIENLLGGFNVTLELLSEAKIDIFKIADLAAILAMPDGEREITKRLEIATANKNYKGSLAMDAADDYDQKQISFSGIPDLLDQLMSIFCGYLRYPKSKLFGTGSSGFSSGEDDLENYNSTVESDVRTPAASLIMWVVKLRCYQLFGRELPDFIPKWKQLRLMSEKDKSEINSRKVQDMVSLLMAGVLTPKQVAKQITEDKYILLSNEEIEKISDEPQTGYNNIDELVEDDI